MTATLLATPAAARTGGQARPRRVARLAVPVSLVLVALATYLTLGLLAGHDIVTAAYDLGIFDQAVRSWAHLHLPVSPLKNSTEGLPADYDLLADHFHPIVATLVPTYWVWPHPVTLVVDQSVLLAASVLPVHAFCRRRVGAVPAVLLCLAYIGSIGLQSAAFFPFHEVAFAPLLIALAVERADVGRWRWATVSALLLLGVKEDLGLLLPFLGLLYAVWGRRRLGALLAVVGIGGFLLVTEVVMPALGTGTYAYWTYASLGPTPLAAARTLALHPLDLVHALTARDGRGDSVRELLTPVGPLPLLSPVFLLAVPLLAERYLSDREVLWSNQFQYELTLMPVLVLAVADSLARVRRLLPIGPAGHRLLATGVAVLVVLGTVSVTVKDRFPLRTLAVEHRFSAPDRLAALRAALRTIPPGTTVAATNVLVPQLLDRDDVRLLTRADPGTRWVIVARGDLLVPWQHDDSAADRAPYLPDVGLLQRDGYVLVHLDAQVAVLRR